MDSERSEEANKAPKKNQQKHTKVLQTYDPGLSFRAHRRRDKAVEQVAKPDWSDRHRLPTKSTRQPTHQPRRAEKEKEEDDEDWLLHITAPDSVQDSSGEGNAETDPWDNDIFSDSYKHSFGKEIENALNQMTNPEASKQTLDNAELDEMEEESGNDTGDHALQTYEPTLTESMLSTDLVEELDEDGSNQSNDLVRAPSEGGSSSETNQEANTLFSWQAITLTDGNGIAMRQSSDDGLLSQTREQLSNMAGGFSMFREKEEMVFGRDVSQESGKTAVFEGSTDFDMTPTGLSDQKLFFDRNENTFSTVDSSLEPSFGAEQDPFGEGFTKLGGESNFHVGDKMAARSDLNLEATGVRDLRNQGPKDLIGQSDPFPEEADRFKFLGE